MESVAPLIHVDLGQLVRRRTDPKDTPRVGRVFGLVFGARDLALVRWQGTPPTFEPEDTLIEIFRLRT